MVATGIVESSYGLSALQHGLLFESLYAQQSGVYIQQLVCTLRHELNVLVFTRAWQRVVDRYAVFRTSFHWQGLHGPIQQVHPNLTLSIEEQDWRDLSVWEREIRLDEYLQIDRRRGFEINQPPLMRLALFRTAEADHTFVWTSHHALLDGRSRLLILKEVFALYEAFCHWRDLELDEPTPFKNYIDELQQQDLVQAEAFWRKALKGFIAPTPLIGARTSSQIGRWGHAEHRFQLTEAETSVLKLLAYQQKLTLNTLIQGAWALLLSRYVGSEDVVFGLTKSCRPKPAASTVGLLINTLPVRVSVNSETSLLAYLKNLRVFNIALRDHQHTPLVSIREWSDLPATSPLFESLVVFENYELNATLRGLGGDWEKREFQLLERTNHPLVLSGCVNARLSLKLAYDCGRFDDAAIKRMAGHFSTLLKDFVNCLEQPLGKLALLTAPEIEQLSQWNKTEKDYSKDKCIHELYEAQAARTPAAVALKFEAEQLTYQQLNERANQLAHYLRSRGVAPETRVGICVERSVAMVVGLLGILKAGAAYVALDPEYPEERLAFMMADAEVSILLTQESLLEQLSELKRENVICLDSDWSLIAEQGRENPLVEVSPANLAYIIYTSGSTGQPKGVAITHRSTMALLCWALERFSADLSTVLASTSICFDVSIFELFAPLSSGGTIVLVRNVLEVNKLSPTQCVKVICTVPSALTELLRVSKLPSSVEVVNFGGEALAGKLVQAAYEQKGVREVNNLYGPSEDTTYSTCALVRRDERAEPTIGRPITNTQAYILDRGLGVVPVGVTGEIYLGGAGLARGYWQRAALTAERFIPNPHAAVGGERLYRTGDLARYLPDGEIDYLGRSDQQVKLRGFRIELGEIETVLARHPAVAECVVTARVDDEEKDRRLVGYLVGAAEQRPDVSELRRHLSEKLPDFMLPTQFVWLAEMPRTPNGKVDRTALPRPERTRFELEAAFVAPRTPEEAVLADIFEQVLKVDQVGIHDNFFTLGGHSLLATQVVSRIRQHFNLDVPLTALFKATTVAALSLLIEELIIREVTTVTEPEPEWVLP